MRSIQIIIEFNIKDEKQLNFSVNYSQSCIAIQSDWSTSRPSRFQYQTCVLGNLPFYQLYSVCTENWKFAIFHYHLAYTRAMNGAMCTVDRPAKLGDPRIVANSYRAHTHRLYNSPMDEIRNGKKMSRRIQPQKRMGFLLFMDESHLSYPPQFVGGKERSVNLEKVSNSFIHC